MNDRAHALAILRQARDILAHRLTERIVEMEEELLDDARGLTYFGEIETVYEQIAARLGHVNAMLSQLPAEEVTSRASISHQPIHLEPAVSSERRGTLSEGELASCQGVLPQAGDTLTAPQEVTAWPTAVTFESFARQVLCGELEWAGRSLAVLFAVDEQLGRRCAEAFHARLAEAPETMTRLLQLRRELQIGGINGPLRLLNECFSLQGLEAMSVLQTLRARLIGHNEAA